MILFINACVRSESRTKQMADRLLERFSDTIEEVRVHELAQSYYGIPDATLLKATGLDLVGADVEGIMCRALQEIDALPV